ncbi:glutaredoxin family protein [Patescibacteria group bacterium]|nr:glutaredoxin family protein [Patescibacteria group bacterium]
MKNNFYIKKKIILAIFILLFSFFSFNIGASNNLALADSGKNNSDTNHELCLHFFYKPDCSQCQHVNVFLEELENEDKVEIEKYNIREEDDKKLYDSFKSRYGLISSAYPVVFIGDNYLMGDKSIINNLESEIDRCQKHDCPCPLAIVNSNTASVPQSDEITAEDPEVLDLPLVGEMDFSSMPIYVTTGIIAFVDGFNPCSLWLITFLIGIVIYSRSRKKIIIVGGTFLLVTGGVYALFMAGLLNVFSYVGYLAWIQIVVAIVAAIFALVNIKDYFWYKKGISFTISDKYKPKIFKNMRGIMKGDKSLWQMVVGTAILALGVVLVELPCTAGFPVVWTNILAQGGIEGGLFYSLLALYMLIYLLDEVVVLLIAAWTMRASRFEEKHGRMLKLIGGMVMLSLAIVMIVNPDLMHNISGSVIVFAGAIALSFLIMYFHRYLLPKFGIRIGSEKEIIEEKKEKEDEENNDELDNKSDNEIDEEE